MQSSSKQLTLITQEGDAFKVDARIVDMSIFLKDMLEEKDDMTGEDVPLPSIGSTQLRQIIEYCEHFKFKKDSTIPYPLPRNNLSEVLTDQWEAQFI